MKKKMITICGVGALGSNIALNLAYDIGDSIEMYLIDYDKVERRNISAGTQIFMREHLGKPKVIALAMMIQKLTGMKTKPCIYKLVENWRDDQYPIPFSERNALFIDCFDNVESRNIFFSFKNRDILHIGFSPMKTGEIRWHEYYQKQTLIETEIDICEAASARSFIQLMSAKASLTIQEFLNTRKKRNWLCNGQNFCEML